MSIFNEAYITELFFNKKKKEVKKQPPKEESYSGKCTKVEVTSSNKSIFDRLYDHEALTAEGMIIANDQDLEKVNNWFRINSKCNASNVNIYIIKGKAMNTFYHLTGDNAYKDDLTIVCIDWVEHNAKSLYKGVWRWFSDVVDNNARREIAVNNPYYDHYYSIYYGNIGNKD